MMMNLFSIFDPSTQIFHLSLNWLSLSLILILFPYKYWVSSPLYTQLMSNMTKNLMMEVTTLVGSSKYKNTSLTMITVFYLIMTLNIMGLLPYIFTPTSHPILTITLALPCWLALILFGWYNNTQHMFAHLVPHSTPSALMSFMVCIETVSNLIRPLTLSVRLAANMIAGHLLMTLLGGQGVSINKLMLPLMMLIQLLLLVLESAVALIQAYVFMILMTLYISEVSYDYS